MKKILIINNYDSFVFNIAQLLRESVKNPAFEIVCNDHIDFDRLDEYGGIILSPGPGIPSEAGDLLPLIDACKYNHPILGICLGHQAIAEVFGGSLYNMPYPLHGHKTVLKITDCCDSLLTGLSRPIVVGRYHSWVVSAENFPTELIISSVDEQENIMSFYHSSLPIHAVQFHPESYRSECGAEIIANWLNEAESPCK